MKLVDYIEQCQQQAELALDHWLQPNRHAPRLSEAMRYSVFNGGKRIRPLLCFASARSVGGDERQVADLAAAVELIHAYSLIHDDLPAMDDDDLRRGKPTCHIAYDEATAILAGDALQALAFEATANARDIGASERLHLLTVLAKASGYQGMVAGQAIDLQAVDQQLTLKQLETMHRHKTGALISASVEMGAIACGAGAEQIQALERYASAIGLAFQVQDDILDIESDTDTLGKTQGADIARNKPTYPALLGLDGAKKKASELLDKALAAIAPLGAEANMLAAIAHYVVERRY